MRGRKKRPASAYKSGLESKLAAGILKECQYEPKGCKVSYSVHSTYTPDFIHRNQPDVMIEVKGFLIHGAADCRKYISVVRDNPDKELVFIFSNPNAKAYPQCSKRKDGTFLSLGEWCKKNNILFFSTTNVPIELCTGLLGVSELRRMKNEAPI